MRNLPDKGLEYFENTQPQGTRRAALSVNFKTVHLGMITTFLRRTQTHRQPTLLLDISPHHRCVALPRMAITQNAVRHTEEFTSRHSACAGHTSLALLPSSRRAFQFRIDRRLFCAVNCAATDLVLMCDNNKCGKLTVPWTAHQRQGQRELGGGGGWKRGMLPPPQGRTQLHATRHLTFQASKKQFSPAISLHAPRLLIATVRYRSELLGTAQNWSELLRTDWNSPKVS